MELLAMFVNQIEVNLAKIKLFPIPPNQMNKKQKKTI